MNFVINLDHVSDNSTKAAEWRAKLPDEVNSNEQDD
jgi:hypothetical protein